MWLSVINYCVFCMFREPVATGSFTPRDSRHPNERKQLPVRLVKRSSLIRLSNKKKEWREERQRAQNIVKATLYNHSKLKDLPNFRNKRQERRIFVTKTRNTSYLRTLIKRQYSLLPHLITQVYNCHLESQDSFRKYVLGTKTKTFFRKMAYIRRNFLTVLWSTTGSTGIFKRLWAFLKMSGFSMSYRIALNVVLPCPRRTGAFSSGSLCSLRIPQLSDRSAW